MDDPNNQKGVLLALSSSAFIGVSFIVKKKGLVRARASGSGAAAAGGYAYLREWLWWAGLLTMVLGEVANFTAYGYAPAILVTPLGALSVILSAILASIMLDEQLLLLGKVGCFLCIVGSTVIVLNAPAEEEATSVADIKDRIVTSPGFQFYAAFVLVSSLVLIFVVAPRWGHKNLLVYVTICSMVGSISVIGVKGLAIAIKLTFAGNNQFKQGTTWGFVVLVVVSIVTQMNYLNKALDTFNTAMVTPIYYVMFTTCTIISSALLFQGWGQATDETEVTPSPGQNCTAVVSPGYGAPEFMTVLSGFLTICSGVLLLHLSRQEALKEGQSRVSLTPRGSTAAGSIEQIAMHDMSGISIDEEQDDADTGQLLPKMDHNR